jgi:hypothetical protein
MKRDDLDGSLEAAAALLSIAMRDTEMPATALGGALGRMSADLIEWRKEARNTDDQTRRLRLERELAVCIESLQFQDRLIQQLTAIRDLLLQKRSIETTAIRRVAITAAEGSIELF